MTGMKKLDEPHATRSGPRSEPAQPRADAAGVDRYFDANGSTPLHPLALEAGLPYLAQVCGNPGAAHPSGQAAKQAIEAAREVVASAIGARASEITFTSGGTESNNTVVFGVAPRAGRGHFVVSAIEHKSVLAALEVLEARGHAVTRVAPHRDGAVRVRDVEAALRADTVLVSVMTANNETGIVQPAREIGALCRARGVRFHADAVCTFGKLPVDVRELGCDYLSIGAHKVYAPKGVGVLYARAGAPLAPLIHGCGQQDGRRAGTENTFGVVAFARAVELLQRGALSPAEPYEKLREDLWRGLQARVPGVRKNGQGACLPNTLNVCFPRVSGADLQRELGARGFSVLASATPSHVLLAMGLDETEARGSVRFSLSRATTSESVALLLAAIEDVWRARGGASAGAAHGGGHLSERAAAAEAAVARASRGGQP